MSFVTAAETSKATLTREAAKELDRLALVEYGIPGIVLMENAARSVASVLTAARDAVSIRALIVCGPGNNGGDGLAAARHLHNAGARVAVLLAADPARMKGDALTNLVVIERMALPMRVATGASARAGFQECARLFGATGPTVVIDALFGTGLTRALDSDMGALVERIGAARSAGAEVVAVDVPSGLDADTGVSLGTAVVADFTVTFGAWKSGFVHPGARPYTGRVFVGDLGVPRELVARLCSSSEGD